MPTIDQAKGMAKRLRSALAMRSIEIPHAVSLELVAAELGHRDWNTAAVKLQPAAADGNSLSTGHTDFTHLRCCKGA